MVRAKKFFGLSISILFFMFLGCDKQSQKVEVTKETESAENESKVSEDTWGYSDIEQAPAEITEEAPLEVEGGLVHNVGRVCDGQKVIYSLKLKNTSDKPWKLQDISADCSCTNIDGIPGGIMLEPGKAWKMGIRIDGGRISEGEFEKHITLEPLKYKPVVIAIRGTLERFYQTIPSNRKLSFDSKGRPDEPWKASLELEGIGAAKDILDVELIPSKSSYLKIDVKKIASGRWSVEASPVKALPYSNNYVESIEFKTLEPEGYPNVRLTVQGKVGMSLMWRAGSVRLKEDDFVEGIAERSFQLGVDVNDTFSPQGRITLRKAESVDWKKLYSTLEIRAPEGVETKTEQTRLGVRLDVKIKREVFNERKKIAIESGCNGNWEGKPITIVLAQ